MDLHSHDRFGLSTSKVIPFQVAQWRMIPAGTSSSPRGVLYSARGTEAVSPPEMLQRN
jgi:hypothetical protein